MQNSYRCKDGTSKPKSLEAMNLAWLSMSLMGQFDTGSVAFPEYYEGRRFNLNPERRRSCKPISLKSSGLRYCHHFGLINPISLQVLKRYLYGYRKHL